MERLLDIGVGMLISVSAATLFFSYQHQLTRYFNTALVRTSEQKNVTILSEWVQVNQILGSEVILQLLNRDENKVNIEVDGQMYTYNNHMTSEDRIKENISFIHPKDCYIVSCQYNTDGQLIGMRYLPK